MVMLVFYFKNVTCFRNHTWMELVTTALPLAKGTCYSDQSIERCASVRSVLFIFLGFVQWITCQGVKRQLLHSPFSLQFTGTYTPATLLYLKDNKLLIMMTPFFLVFVATNLLHSLSLMKLMQHWIIPTLTE